MKHVFMSLVLALCAALSATAQIGYQVSLLDKATGEARANETVSVVAEITDSDGAVILSQTQSVRSNDQGVLSLTLGNSSTFDNADWGKLPFYISATVDGTLLGKSQILNVPVAEHAKHWGTLTKEILMSKTWSCTEISPDVTGPEPSFIRKWTFNESSYVYECIDPDGYKSTYTGSYYIYGDIVFSENDGWFFYYPEKGWLYKGNYHGDTKGYIYK